MNVHAEQTRTTSIPEPKKTLSMNCQVLMPTQGCEAVIRGLPVEDKKDKPVPIWHTVKSLYSPPSLISHLCIKPPFQAKGGNKSPLYYSPFAPDANEGTNFLNLVQVYNVFTAYASNL